MGRLLQTAFIGRKMVGGDMIERHNPLLIFDVVFLYLAEQQRMTQVLAAGAKEREREREKCVYTSLS
jgi:hypothetical protein